MWFTSFHSPRKTDQHEKTELLLKVYFINNYHWTVIYLRVRPGRNCTIDKFRLPWQPVTTTAGFVTSIAACAEVYSMKLVGNCDRLFSDPPSDNIQPP
jgi:hypothetical protein